MFALMVTYIVTKGPNCSPSAIVERLSAHSINPRPRASSALPGVMSRKKQVAPKLLVAAAR